MIHYTPNGNQIDKTVINEEGQSIIVTGHFDERSCEIAKLVYSHNPLPDNNGLEECLLVFPEINEAYQVDVCLHSSKKPDSSMLVSIIADSFQVTIHGNLPPDVMSALCAEFLTEGVL